MEVVDIMRLTGSLIFVVSGIVWILAKIAAALWRSWYDRKHNL